MLLKNINKKPTYNLAVYSLFKSSYIKNNKLKKHLNFCVKYPETVIGADDSALIVQYMIDNNITPLVDYFKVGRMAEFHKMDSNVFVKFKELLFLR